MKPASTKQGTALPITERSGTPDDDAIGLTEEKINEVVVEFYRRTLLDERLEPVFSSHVHDWDEHLSRMTDFWSAALLKSGRFSGRPVERHRAIEGLSDEHFERWLVVLESTVRDLCIPRHAGAFLLRARRMRVGMTRALDLHAVTPAPE